MKIAEKIKESYSIEAMLLAIASFLAGIIVGFIASSGKNGITIGSYNGWYNGWFNGSGKKSLHLKNSDDETDND